MPPSRLALGGLLLAAPLLAPAQTVPTVPAPPAVPRLSVGLGVYSSDYHPFQSQPLGSRGWSVPTQLTVGYQLRPRLAVQLGVAYSSNNYSYSYAYQTYNGGSYPYLTGYTEVNGASTIRHLSVSALARYTLTRKPAHRMQFDLLGGLTVESAWNYARGTQADSISGNLAVTPYSYRTKRGVLLVTAGLGTRFRISPRFDLNYDITLNRALDNLHSNGFTGAQTLGLRYHFGQR